MSTLKTDYKDAIYSGDKQYQITQSGSNSTIKDVTNYEQEGDPFCANDINRTNAEINRMNHITLITLSQSNWTLSSGTIYTQRVDIAELTSDMDLEMMSALPYNSTLDQQKAYNKMFTILSQGVAETYDGYAMFKIYKQASSNITVALKGI